MTNNIKDITQRLLIPCGHTEVEGETHTKYICKGNLIEELTQHFISVLEELKMEDVKCPYMFREPEHREGWEECAEDLNSNIDKAVKEMKDD